LFFIDPCTFFSHAASNSTSYLPPSREKAKQKKPGKKGKWKKKKVFVYKRAGPEITQNIKKGKFKNKPVGKKPKWEYKKN